MAIGTAFRVLLPNRPGEIANLAKSLAQAGVNIETGAAVANGREAYFEFQVNTPEVAADVLRELGAIFQQVPVLVVWVPNQPGELARVLVPLAENGINIDSLYIVRTEADHNLVAIGCRELDKADKLLSPPSGSDEE